MNSSDIQALKNTSIRRIKNLGPHLMTTNNYPLLYQPITKCGSTFLRNILWYLDNKEPLPPGFDRESQPWAAGWKPSDILNNKHKFTVVRHPVQRFMSLYFDKILGKTEGVPIRLSRAFLRNSDIDQDAGEDLEVHRRNCGNALEFIANQFATQPHSKINWHWKPQMVRMSHLRDFGFSTVHLEGLDWQLPQVIGGLVPNIDKALKAVKTANRSVKPVKAEDILTKELRLKIREIYQTDYLIWKEVRNFWQDKQG
ncbi:MAG: sulfotransferase family protein [Rhodobacteraceae bacterium]|nr:sulfotransferase family protein [Paracoccaceae bacterium]